MDTTLNKIREHIPCRTSWEKLLASLGKTKADDEPISFRYLLDTLGIEDAVWCIRTITHKEQCLFLADVLELMLPEWEKYRDDPAPGQCIQAIRDHEQGLISDAELQAAAAAAYAVVNASTIPVVTYVVDTVFDRGNYDEMVYHIIYNATRRDYVRNSKGDRVLNKWQEIEAFFIKHFVEE